uniref:Putative defensin 2 n=1 Tax=Panstrongylus lignarius TaxID=156445 RepID=A0A224Y299_9HEMI
MKCTLCLVTLFLVVALAYSYPAAELAQQQLVEAVWEQPAVEVHASRVKRDHICGVVLPGPLPGLNHEGCNSHCRIQGYKGGVCAGPSCQCV